ncbi:MAG TPA: aldo/keto reductase, partial [Gemmatimonadaceae bacterium]|nr:aldo/keto reductase [Gemmatimonadaceae bacterium]
TLSALDHLVRQGKVLYLGASSMYAWQLMKALSTSERHGWARFVSMQNHYNLVYREEEREMIPLCLDQGLGVIPWSPLARGLLGGKRQRGGHAASLRDDGDGVLVDQLYDHPADWDVVDATVRVAARRGVQPAQVALAWLLSRPAVTAPIVGTTKLEQLEAAAAAAALQLTAEECAELEAPYRPHPVRGWLDGALVLTAQQHR